MLECLITPDGRLSDSIPRILPPEPKGVSLIRNVYSAPKELVVAHDGLGQIKMSRIFGALDFKSKCDFVDHSVIPPGTSIGGHTHENNEEVYFIIKGKGLMTVDGEEVEVSAGDLIFNKCYGTHALKNSGDEPIEILVFQVSV